MKQYDLCTSLQQTKSVNVGTNCCCCEQEMGDKRNVVKGQAAAKGEEVN